MPVQIPDRYGCQHGRVSGIFDDEACREASCQEIIRRYYQALEKVVKDDSCQNEAYKIELIMKQAKISPKDRVVVPAAVNLAKETDAPAAALELPDGKIVLGKTKESSALPLPFS